MKTKNFLPLMLLPVLLMSILSISSKAQQYHPFPEEDASWTVVEFNYDYWEYETYIYTVKGDTSLNGKTYKKVYQLNDIPNSNDTLWTLHNFMRQEVDNKKIYFIRHYQGENVEKLGYDFDVEIGDTIILPAFDYANIGDSIFELQYTGDDSVLINNGEYRNIYFFVSLYPPYGNLSLYAIEGIGDVATPIPSLFFFDDFHRSTLTCHIVNDEYIYGPSPYPDECDFTVRVDENRLKNNIICRPNPADRYISLVLPNINAEKYSLRLINSLGATILFQNIVGINSSDHILEVSALPSGIYNLIVESNKHYYTNKIIINH